MTPGDISLFCRSYTNSFCFYFFTGTSFPVNSVGKLPHFVLDTDMKQKALGMYHNIKQIQQQYHAHEEKVKKSALFFTPFPEITEGLFSLSQNF